MAEDEDTGGGTSVLADMTARQRAAAVIVAIGPEAAGSVLGYLDVTDVETLTREIMHLGRLPSDHLNAIIAEILGDLGDQIMDSQGGFEYAKSLLQHWEGTKAQDILATHHPSYLTPEQDQEIRARFNILL